MGNIDLKNELNEKIQSSFDFRSSFQIENDSFRFKRKDIHQIANCTFPFNVYYVSKPIYKDYMDRGRTHVYLFYAPKAEEKFYQVYAGHNWNDEPIIVQNGNETRIEFIYPFGKLDVYGMAEHQVKGFQHCKTDIFNNPIELPLYSILWPLNRELRAEIASKNADESEKRLKEAYKEEFHRRGII